MQPFELACPRCHSPLEPVSADRARCPVDDLNFLCVEGIWQFILPERTSHFETFIRDYETIRCGEGRGSDNAAYYAALPFRDLTGRFTADWRIRAASYRAFVDTVLLPVEQRTRRPLRVVDLGAGNGWLSYRLAGRGHALAAVDLQTHRFDGLGAHVHYDVRFLCLQAEFDRLPLAAGQADMVVYNASLHYAEDYVKTLGEALRVLSASGIIVALDSPLYHDPHSGERMVREREEHFRRRFGLSSDALDSENFLTESRLDELASALSLRWRRVTPFYGLRWAVRPLLARLRRRREPARFAILIAGRA